MIFLFIFLVIPVATTLALKEGDKCSVLGGVGVCKIVYQCPYADNLVKIDERRPVHCGWHNKKDRVELVCCPIEDKTHFNGVFRSIFSQFAKGVVQSKTMNCKYDGVPPIICCPNKPVNPIPPEPASCPLIPTLRNPSQTKDLIWRKCYEYQRYLYPCVASSKDPNVYVRSNKCGQNSLTERIHGGTPANNTEFPHMALLGCRAGLTTKWVGGGTLISESFILTAAHVVSHIKYGLVRYALLGTVTKNTRDGALYNIIKIDVHDLYDKSSKYNDIALLTLDRSVIMSEYILPACLPIPDANVGDEKMVTGWGKTSQDGLGSEVLLKALVVNLASSICKERLDLNHLTHGWRDESMVCAGDLTSKKQDTCEGDSGGPLQVYLDDLNCSYIVEGIVSWGPNCGKGHPAVYTRVRPYIDWITNIVWPVGST